MVEGGHVAPVQMFLITGVTIGGYQGFYIANVALFWLLWGLNDQSIGIIGLIVSFIVCLVEK